MSRTPQAPGPRVAVEAERYRVVRFLAEGGLGRVLEAHDEELDRRVALKEMQDRLADDPGCRARFVREAEITGKLEHPGVVPVYSLGYRPDGQPFYAMRFVEGESLKEALARHHAPGAAVADPAAHRMQFRTLMRRFVDACHTIAYAHARGVLHRDIKPANLMLGPYGETLVVDWGLAKTLGEAPERPRSGSSAGDLWGTEETVSGSALGTPQTMSPEQARGEVERLGPACDIYGLGATLFLLLTGCPPVEGDDPRSVVDRVARGEIRTPRQVSPTVPRALDAVCRKAMAFRPEDRYATAQDLASDVDRWLADEPVRAEREPWPDRLRRLARRHKMLVATQAIALSVLLVGVATGFHLHQLSQWETRRQQQVIEGMRASNQVLSEVVALLSEQPDDAAAPSRALDTASIEEAAESVVAELQADPGLPAARSISDAPRPEASRAPDPATVDRKTPEADSIRRRFREAIQRLRTQGRADVADRLTNVVRRYEGQVNRVVRKYGGKTDTSDLSLIGD